MTGKQIARALRRAAKTADRERVGLCTAISFATPSDDDVLWRETKHLLYEVMRDRPPGAWFWWGTPSRCSDADHTARILGALFAAHYAEDEL